MLSLNKIFIEIQNKDEYEKAKLILSVYSQGEHIGYFLSNNIEYPFILFINSINLLGKIKGKRSYFENNCYEEILYKDLILNY